MRKPTRQKTVIELTRRGVFQLRRSPCGDTERKKIARLIRLRAIGKRDDGVTFAQIRFRTMHGDYRLEFFAWSKLLPRNRHEIQNTLAELDRTTITARLGRGDDARHRRRFARDRWSGLLPEAACARPLI